MSCFPNLAASYPLDPDFKRYIVDSVWPLSTGARTLRGPGTVDVTDLDAFLEFVDRLWATAPADGHSARSFDDIVYLIGMLRTKAALSLEQLMQTIRDERPDLAPSTDRLTASLELAARLWLMLDVRNLMPANQIQLQKSLPWPQAKTLQAVLDDNLVRNTKVAAGEFCQQMNVHDMSNIAGIRVEWTDNLVSHLSMNGSVLYMFHNVSALRRMRQSDCLLEQDFLDETLATIDLLIPLTRAACNTWLNEESKRPGMDSNIVHRNRPDPRKSSYPYWQDRLLMIEEAFEKTNPRSVFQWWYDTRDMQKWWTFWLAAAGIFLTVLFGLIQSVTGIISVAKSS